MKRLTAVLLTLVMLCAGMIPASAALSSGENLRRLYQRVANMADDERLEIGIELENWNIPTNTDTMAAIKKYAETDPAIGKADREGYPSPAEIHDYYDLWREVKREVIKQWALDLMDRLGLTFEDLSASGYNEENIADAGLLYRWRVTKAKALELARNDEIINIWFYDKPAEASPVYRDAADKTPEEKLLPDLKTRLSYLDEGERITVCPHVFSMRYEAIYAMLAAEYGITDPDKQGEKYREIASWAFSDYYTAAYAALLDELNPPEEYVTMKENAHNAFFVKMTADEIAALSQRRDIEEIGYVSEGFTLAGGAEEYVDTSDPIFRRFMKWGEENGYRSTLWQFEVLHEDVVRVGDEDHVGQFTDWALLRVGVGFPPPWMVKFGVGVGGRFLYSIGGYEMFDTGYAIYDAFDDTFYPLTAESEKRYPGLKNVLWELQLGTPIGDVDFDGKLTILDATIIQRHLAAIEPLEWVYCGGKMDDVVSYSDIDGDGKVTIMDATRIQRALASLF